VIFEKMATAGGLMRTNIPAFPSPRERARTTRSSRSSAWASDVRYNAPIASLKSLLDERL